MTTAHGVHTATRHHLETCQSWFCVKWQPIKLEPEANFESPPDQAPLKCSRGKHRHHCGKPPTTITTVTYPVPPGLGDLRPEVPRCLLTVSEIGEKLRRRS